MVDLTRDEKGKTRARLLDLAPGRSGREYLGWLQERGEAFTAGVTIATLDPFRGTRTPSTTSCRTRSPSLMPFT
jgi:uracil-DNA glycosylase